VLHGRFVVLIWTENQCGASSTDCGIQASWFYEGDVRKIRATCSLKIKEMIMPGIMSEGVTAIVGPRCAAH
jgi:coenzyme F420-reducing hydrogenase delta subunit